jgi:hypothetical protein
VFVGIAGHEEESYLVPIVAKENGKAVEEEHVPESSTVKEVRDLIILLGITELRGIVRSSWSGDIGSPVSHRPAFHSIRERDPPSQVRKFYPKQCYFNH